MKEALSVIASAWSVAFMLLFLGMCSLLDDSIETAKPMFTTAFFVLMTLAVTGSGWLGYRSRVKQERKREDAKNG